MHEDSNCLHMRDVEVTVGAEEEIREVIVVRVGTILEL